MGLIDSTSKSRFIQSYRSIIFRIQSCMITLLTNAWNELINGHYKHFSSLKEIDKNCKFGEIYRRKSCEWNQVQGLNNILSPSSGHSHCVFPFSLVYQSSTLFSFFSQRKWGTQCHSKLPLMYECACFTMTTVLPGICSRSRQCWLNMLAVT